MPSIYTSFPLQLSTIDPDGATETCRFLDNRIVETHYLLALLLGLDMDTNLTQGVGFGHIPVAQGINCLWDGSGTQLQMRADSLELAVLPQGFTLSVAPTPLTNDITLGGPIANGRDQVGAFGSNVFIYFHWIYNTTTATLATVSSLSATAPTMPAGYQQGPLAGAMRIGGTANVMLRANIRGKWTQYYTPQSIISSGTTGNAQVADFSTFVPATAVASRAHLTLAGTVGGSDQTVTIYDGAGDTVQILTLLSEIRQVNGIVIEAPMLTQGLTYDLPNVGRAGLNFAMTCLAFENA